MNCDSIHFYQPLRYFQLVIMIKYSLIHVLIMSMCWDISHVFCAVSGQNTNITRYYVKVDAAVAQIKFMSCPTMQLSRGLISCGIRCASHRDCIAFDITPSECLLCFFNITGLYNIQGKLFREKLPITSGKPSFYVILISSLYLNFPEFLVSFSSARNE